MSEKIDWSNLENIEPVPGGEWDGCKIVGRYPGTSDRFPHLVIVQDADGACEAETTTDDGRIWPNDPPVIRNKPKRMTLEEFWVIYTPQGVRLTFTRRSDAAADCAKRGYIVRHIPAETIEV